MKASSASGLCARRIVRLAGTRASGGDLGRLDVEGLEVVLVLGVLGPPAGAPRRLLPAGLGGRPPPPPDVRGRNTTTVRSAPSAAPATPHGSPSRHAAAWPPPT